VRRALVFIVFFVVAFACSRQPEPRVIDGAGATLPYPLYSRWAAEYARIDPTLRVNYQSVGSGGGIRQISDGLVDFGATDEPMSDEQLKHSPAVVHVPLTIGAVVLAYNVPSVKDLKLTPDLVADLFRGTVTRWDDVRIRTANPDIVLPNEALSIVHRADGSGTSATFTTYLSKNSPAWKTEVGSGTSPRFPVGVGAKGNDGVTAYVKSTPFTLGYVELAYAREAGLSIALVKNRAGKYVPPTQSALDRAARSALGRVPDDLRLSIVDAEDEDAYPIAALSFVLLPREARDPAKGDALGKFVWWALHDGQAFAPALGYAPLPPELVLHGERALHHLTVGGRPLSLPDPGG
jgi:phosphate transport system substrate-binding protein